MAERVIIAVTVATHRWLEGIRHAQDGSDAEPCFGDAEIPCGFCGEPTQYVNGTGDSWICDDCLAAETRRLAGGKEHG